MTEDEKATSVRPHALSKPRHDRPATTASVAFGLTVLVTAMAATASFAGLLAHGVSRDDTSMAAGWLTDDVVTGALVPRLLPSSTFGAPSSQLPPPYTFGAADSVPDAAEDAELLGAQVYRLVMDPNVPLDEYAKRVEAYRAHGMRPQLVVGGAGTRVRGKTSMEARRIISYALRALRRWPNAYSVSVVNEPDLAGQTACRYLRTFRAAYRRLKRAGAQRVLFGEWSPTNPHEWTLAVLNRCAVGMPVAADGWAWHCYDAGPDWYGIHHTPIMRDMLRRQRRMLRTPRGSALPIHCTEYGVLTRSQVVKGRTEQDGANQWVEALRAARMHRVREILAWQIREACAASRWDTSLRRADGSYLPAFLAIVAAHGRRMPAQPASPTPIAVARDPLPSVFELLPASNLPVDVVPDLPEHEPTPQSGPAPDNPPDPQPPPAVTEPPATVTEPPATVPEPPPEAAGSRRHEPRHGLPRDN